VTRGLGFSCLIQRTAPFSRFLRHTREFGGSILIRVLTGPHSVTPYDTQENSEDLFLPGSPRVKMAETLDFHIWGPLFSGHSGSVTDLCINELNYQLHCQSLTRGRFTIPLSTSNIVKCQDCWRSRLLFTISLIITSYALFYYLNVYSIVLKISK
jgi:hypothetical protein